MSLDRILHHLKLLVACDSRNPPRAITPDASMFRHIRDVLDQTFEISMDDHGDGHVSLLAVRGAPKVLFNCHLDTVPVGAGWTRPALAATVDGDRVHGRGACDIKGAAAALLALAESTDAPMALLFTTDEEGAGGCCVRHFIGSGRAARFEQVVVCEPTGCRAVLAHRGYLSVRGTFSGVSGHSSEFRALDDNANHRLAAWMIAAVAECRRRAAVRAHTCFNIGRIDGGTKSNVIADQACVHYSARLGPGGDNRSLFEALSALAGDEVVWEVPFSGPPLPANGQDFGKARAFATGCGLEVGDPVDFWTEAALFSEAGLPALVLGPGDIAQAHTADEWVSLGQLETALERYGAVIGAEEVAREP